MYSVLQNKTNIKFFEKPYPYIIIDEALPLDLYNDLNDNFPKYEKIINKNEYKENFAYRYSAAESLIDPDIISSWKEFISYHTSYDFISDFYNIFGNSIKKYYPNSNSKLPNETNIGIRTKDNSYFQTDCQFVINTPSKIKTSVITPHLDSPNKFYAALLYMRDYKDDSFGGNFTINAYSKKRSFHNNTRLLKECNLIQEVEYTANRLVMFLNTPLSIHGVTERSPTNFHRRYINFVGQFNFELFNYKQFENN